MTLVYESIEKIVSRKCIFAVGLYHCAKDKRITAGEQPVRKSKGEK